jgi:pSer/pThr/pTyr-binding forkhead associated (FHA) protein
VVKKSTVIGRGTDTDVHVVARGVSRHHCEIRWDGKRAEAVDLGSTNGTKLDGERITRAALPDRCTLVMGQARILFEVVPQAEASYRAFAHHTPTGTEETS